MRSARRGLRTLGEAAIAAAGLAAVAACGDDVPPGIDAGEVLCTAPPGERYLPLAVGATWRYQITELLHPGPGPMVVKSSTVEALEDVGGRKAGVTAFRIRSETSAGDVVSWQEDRCTEVIRHREHVFDLDGVLCEDQYFIPSKLRVDESAAHVAAGAMWTVAFTEVHVDPVTAQVETVDKGELWSVQAVAESVTVPAGTFSCLRVHKNTTGNADKTYWFALGVGKIKEEGEQREELIEYVAP